MSAAPVTEPLILPFLMVKNERQKTIFAPRVDNYSTKTANEYSQLGMASITIA